MIAIFQINQVDAFVLKQRSYTTKGKQSCQHQLQHNWWPKNNPGPKAEHPASFTRLTTLKEQHTGGTQNA